MATQDAEQETADPTASFPTEEPTPSALQSLAGRYRFHPLNDETVDYILILRADGTAELDEQPIGSGDTVVQDATGTWSVAEDGQTVIFEVQTILGQPAQQEEMIQLTFTDGVPSVSAIEINEQFIHLENGVFTLGAGESGPLIGELNRRLAAIDFLGFNDPGDSRYGEGTRQAVAAFQESQGLVPSGVVDVRTWVLLDNPQPPPATPTPSPPIVGAPNLRALPSETADGRPILYLTFDDGPDRNYTPALLEVLNQYDARATFFNVGINVVAAPELVREAASQGHYIADHTWDHRSLEGISTEAFISEANRTRQAILEAAGDLFNLDRNVRSQKHVYHWLVDYFEAS